MITLSNGFSFTFCVSSGALNFHGKGYWWEQPFRWLGYLDPKAFDVIVAKTITYNPTKGNLNWYSPWTCINIFDKESVVNAVGLTNPGSKKWINKHYTKAKRMGYNIVPSIKLENQYNIRLDALDVPYIEVNVSCPNSNKIDNLYLLRWIKRPIILKLSIDQINKEFIDQVDPYVEAYHAINTIPWNKMYSGNSPLKKYNLEGGTSGRNIHNIAVNSVFLLSQLTKKPIKGGGGIFSVDDVIDFRNAGAKAFSIGSCFLFHPTRPNRIVKEYYDNKSTEINSVIST